MPKSLDEVRLRVPRWLQRHDRAGVECPWEEPPTMLAWTEELIARRRELGLRQQDLADLAGVSERFVRELESGKESVRLDKLAPVLDVLGLQLSLQPRRTP